MGWLIAAGVLLLLLILPVGVRGIYNVCGLSAYLLIGPVSVRIFPASKASKQEHQKKPGGKKTQKDRTGGSLSDFKPLVRMVLTLLDEFRQKLRVSRLDFQLILAGQDPCDVSLLYARAWAIVGNILPQLERVFVIKDRHIDIGCDYVTEKSRVYAGIDLTITVGRLLYLAVRHGFPILKEYKNILNTRKGGAKL